MNVTIVYKHDIPKVDEYTFDISKGSILGNPFETDCYEAHNEELTLYAGWLDLQIRQNNIRVCNELNRITEAILDGHKVQLLCSCKNGTCHGEIIRYVILKAITGE